MKCENCQTEVIQGSKYCSNCGKELPLKPGKETSATPTSKQWCHTGWVWVWLVIFWPVGIYGLIQRAKPQHQKFWWVGVSYLLFVGVAVLSDLDSYVNTNETTKNSSATSMGGAYIKKGELFCGTEDQFDEQIKWLTQGIMQFSPGCFSTGSDIDVIILDFGLTATKAKGINNGQIYWVASDSIERK